MDKQQKEHWKIKDEARKQWHLPLDEFKCKVKCCYNCLFWQRDITLQGDYAFNICGNNLNIMIAWDSFCNCYKGAAKIDNEIYKLSKEESIMLMNEE